MKPQPKPAAKKVQCGKCRHFTLDTSGPSFSIETGRYFMGVCNAGCTPDSPIKHFADNERICNQYKSK